MNIALGIGSIIQSRRTITATTSSITNVLLSIVLLKGGIGEILGFNRGAGILLKFFGVGIVQARQGRHGRRRRRRRRFCRCRRGFFFFHGCCLVVVVVVSIGIGPPSSHPPPLLLLLYLKVLMDVPGCCRIIMMQ